MPCFAVQLTSCSSPAATASWLTSSMIPHVSLLCRRRKPAVETFVDNTAKLRPQPSVLALRAAGANLLLKPASTTPRSYGQGVTRGSALCASQVLVGGAQAVARGVARCALHVHGRGTRTNACGRSFAVLSTQVSTVDLRLRLVEPRPIPAAVASLCCRRRSQQLVCACDS